MRLLRFAADQGIPIQDDCRMKICLLPARDRAGPEPLEPIDVDFFKGDMRARIAIAFTKIFSEDPPPMRAVTFQLLDAPVRLRYFQRLRILEFYPSMFLMIIFGKCKIR
jgi:hypothetical protein